MPVDGQPGGEDMALVRRMLRGDERAMAEFCDSYLPRLYRFALPRVATPDDADDVVQLVLSNAARRIETFRGESTLYAWLLGICRREVSRHLARVHLDREVVSLYGDRRDLQEDQPGPANDEPESALARRQLARRVHECLDRLPERQSLVLELKYVEGFSSKEIAARLQVSDEAVQSLLARARRAFREVCGDRVLRQRAVCNGGSEPE